MPRIRSKNVNSAKSRRFRGRKGNPRARGGIPKDPKPFTAIKWQPLVIEFDVTLAKAGWGSFQVSDVTEAFRAQTGTDLTPEFKFRKMDVWALTNDLDVDALVYDLTPRTQLEGQIVETQLNVAKQARDVAGKNHWACVRIPWSTKDRQVVLSVIGFPNPIDTSLGAVYVPSDNGKVRVRVSILWRFASTGTPLTTRIVLKLKPESGMDKKVVIDNYTQEITPDSSCVETASASSGTTINDTKKKVFSYSSIVQHSEKTKPRFFRISNDSPSYAGRPHWVYYCEFDCGRCLKQQRVGQHGHHKAKPTMIDRNEFEKFGSVSNLEHSCVIDKQVVKGKKPKRATVKGVKKITARSHAWSLTKSMSSVNPSDSVSNVQFNALVSKIAALESTIKSLVSVKCT